MNKPLAVFSEGLETKSLYQKALESEVDDPKVFGALSKNFVLRGEVVLRTERLASMRHNKSVHYNQKQEAYTANGTGFVDYGELSIEILPMVYVGPEKMKCFGLAPASSDTAFDLDAKILEEEVALTGIHIAPNPHSVEQFIKAFEKGIGGKFLLASGTERIHGKPMIVMPRFDFANKKASYDVEEAAEVATFKPKIIPKNGKNLFGEIVPASQEIVETYAVGKGLTINHDKKAVYAASDGVLELSAGNTLQVMPQKIIHSDIDLSEGDIDFPGNVLIKGSVLKGVRVSASGSLRISGNVEESHLKSESNIIIDGGIMGGHESTIRSEGNLEAGHITAASIQCQGNLIVKNYLVDSEVFCGGLITIKNRKKGKIIGGNLHAIKGIHAPIIGNPNGTKTVLVVGTEKEVRQKAKSLEGKIKDLDKTFEHLKKAIDPKYFEDPHRYLVENKHHTHAILKLKRDLLELKKCLTKRSKLIEEFHKLSPSLQDESSTDVRISVRGYEGISVTINGASKLISKELDRPTIFLYNQEKKAIVAGHLESYL